MTETGAPGPEAAPTRMDQGANEAGRIVSQAELNRAKAAQLRAAAEPSETTEERWLNEVFTYHPPTDEDRAAYALIRGAAKDLVRAIRASTPRCADQTAAIRKVREAVMTANAARALRGLV